MGISKYNSEGYYSPTDYEALKRIEKAERYRPLVYICSPYAGDTEKNTAAARRYCAFAVKAGVIPIAPHLLFPQFTNDREEGLFFGKVLLDKCSEVWVFGKTVTKGMSSEIKRAARKGKRIRRFSSEREEVKE